MLFFLTHLSYFLLDLDFSYSSYIMLHGATAKWGFLVFFVFSLQRGAPFFELCYGWFWFHKQWVVCVCIWKTTAVSEYVMVWVFRWIRHLRAFEKTTAQSSWHGRFCFFLEREIIRTAKSCVCPRLRNLWVHVPRQLSLCSGRCLWHWGHSKGQVVAKVCVPRVGQHVHSQGCHGQVHWFVAAATSCDWLHILWRYLHQQFVRLFSFPELLSCRHEKIWLHLSKFFSVCRKVSIWDGVHGRLGCQHVWSHVLRLDHCR